MYDLVFKFCICITNSNIYYHSLHDYDGKAHRQYLVRLIHIGESTERSLRESQKSYHERRKRGMSTALSVELPTARQTDNTFRFCLNLTHS